VGGEAAEIEQSALAPHGEILEGLEHAGLQQARRALVLSAMDFEWSFEEGLLTLAFSLPAGGYATSFLAEVFDFREPDPNTADLNVEAPMGVVA
jgi:tRNA pseudouridine13 synthase